MYIKIDRIFLFYRNYMYNVILRAGLYTYIMYVSWIFGVTTLKEKENIVLV